MHESVSLTRCAAGIICAAMIALAAGPALAGGVMYVNVDQVIRDSKAGQALARQAREKKESIEASLAGTREGLEEERDSLAEQRSLLSEQAFRTKETTFQGKVQNFQRTVVEENRVMQAAVQETMSAIDAVLARILKEILESRELDMIVSRGAILTANPDHDLTSEVIARLDRRLPEIKVDFSKAAETGETAR